MSLRLYLPSAQFVTLVGALALSGGLVIAAQSITKTPPSTIVTTTPASPLSGDWQNQLDAIQASAGVSLPQAPDAEAVATLTDSVKSSNLTDSIAKTLLIKLTGAKAQGLGDDIPTQDQLIAEASAAAAAPTQPVFKQSDLSLGAANAEDFRAYGNKMAQIIALYPQANAAATLQTFGYVVDYKDATKLASLKNTEQQYTNLAEALTNMSVPSTLAPLHLQAVNDLGQMANDIEDMRAVVNDPLRGLKGLQGFTSRMNELTRVLTTIAGSFSKNGILFSKDEPGSAWSAFVSAS